MSPPGTAPRRLLRGQSEFISPFVIQTFALSLPFIIVPYLTRTLGAHAFGEFAFCQAFATVGAAVVDYGFQISATRSLAQSRHDVGQVRDKASGILAAKFMIGGGFVALGLAFLPLYPEFFRDPAMIGGALAFALFQGLNFYWLFAGLQRVLFASLMDFAARFLAMIGILLLVHGPDHAWLAVWCFAGGNAVTFVGACVIARRWVPGLGLSLTEARSALRSGRHIFAQNVFGNIYVGATSFVLGLFVAPYFVGVFSGAEKLVRAAQLPMMPFRLAAYPRVLARLNESRQAGKELILRLAAILLPAMAMGSLILFLGSDFIVRVILGPQMMPAAHLLRLMALLPPLSAASDILSIFWLLPNGRDRVVTVIVVTALVAQIGIIALLAVPQPASAGGIAVTAAQLIAFLLCAWFAWREIPEKAGK